MLIDDFLLRPSTEIGLCQLRSPPNQKSVFIGVKTR